MTRFARAKGSKSSNEKTPEDGTPWEVMKKQLLESKKDNEDAKKREEVEKQRIENYENFLKEHKVQKRKATWCDFPETQQNGVKPATSTVPEVAQKKKKKNKQTCESQIQDHNNEMNNAQPDPCTKNKERKKKIKVDTQNIDNTENTSSDDPKPTKKNKNKKKQINSYNEVVHSNSEPIEETANSSFGRDKKQKKNKKKNKNTGNNSALEKNMVDKKQNKKELNKQKAKKFENGMPIRRKPIDRSFQLIINGREVELIRFDGFPVMKKDAERLEELKTSMLKKGIPKSEVQRTLKLERRRAEKALARLKRDVCYNCRKGGHNLSDCPDLKSKIPGVDAPEGICFKCGSTEHRQFECKVQRDKEFRFATCFICKEPGHIARQCPDNPKGLYPNGGGCKLCGDVTHLRKDCPTVMDKKEESSVKLQTLESVDNIEDIGQKAKSSEVVESVKKPKKITF